MVDQRFFDLLGVTAAQVRYLLRHSWLTTDYSPVFDYSESAEDGSELPLVFDLGMSGGMDSLFFLIHGFRVLAVEANPLSALDVRHALKRYGRRLTVLTAAILNDDESDVHSSRSPLSDLPMREVDFFIHKERPDFSALDPDRVPRHARAATVAVRALSCADLVAEFGRPYGMKIDAEGADRACLTSLKRVGAIPRYLSAELPNVLKDGPEPAKELMRLLVSMGYSAFKLCRQSLYNARTVMAIHQLTNKSEIMVTRQGLGLGASGPSGEAAVDWIVGPRWREAAEVLADVEQWGPIWALNTLGEWFDLHARLPK